MCINLSFVLNHFINVHYEFVQSASMTAEMRHDVLQKMAKNCQRSEGAKRSELADFLAGDMSSRGAKCIMACLGETSGLVSDCIITFKYVILLTDCFLKVRNNKVDPAGAVRVASTYGDDKSIVEHAKEVANLCIDETDDDRCEAVAKIHECIRNYAQSNGYETGLF